MEVRLAEVRLAKVRSDVVVLAVLATPRIPGGNPLVAQQSDVLIVRHEKMTLAPLGPLLSAVRAGSDAQHTSTAGWPVLPGVAQPLALGALPQHVGPQTLHHIPRTVGPPEGTCLASKDCMLQMVDSLEARSLHSRHRVARPAASHWPSPLPANQRGSASLVSSFSSAPPVPAPRAEFSSPPPPWNLRR